MMRKPIYDLLELGPFPSYKANAELIDKYERLISSIKPPVTDEEATALVKMFGPDDCYGLAWTLLHLIETAPGWPIKDCLYGDNEWVNTMRTRAINGGLL
jgi:hypothetical protein